jgi:hypothetical protein
MKISPFFSGARVLGHRVYRRRQSVRQCGPPYIAVQTFRDRGARVSPGLVFVLPHWKKVIRFV